ncbi:hypothetical protein QTL95_03635 [Rhizobium sp. S152]|uniref:hypothetical protein n=1 Tax=Rhizobium sp. S152 TaxID=3055038 RepID=UPI0025A9774E|nr:hypothetical protein [Rhizobium sp. S152]MDM9624975.1 hypothetical protein [Rhizobium sp. S152]
MTKLDKPLAGMTVMIIDMSDTASSVQQGFVDAGAEVTSVYDEESLRQGELLSLPNVAVIYPGSLEFRRIRYFSNRLLDQRNCVSLLYDDQFPEDDHTSKHPLIIYRSRPVEDVIAAAISGLQKISSKH